MTPLSLRLCAFGLTLILCVPAIAQFTAGGGSKDPQQLTQAKLQAPAVDRLSAGQSISLLLSFNIAQGHHIYDPEPGAAEGQQTTVSLELPAGLSAGALRWPPYDARPILIGVDALSHQHHGAFAVVVPLTASQDLPGAVLGQVKAKVKLFICDDRQCLPPFSQTLVAQVSPGSAFPAALAKAEAAAAQRAGPASQPLDRQAELVKLSLQGPGKPLTPGQSAELAVVIDIAPSWHIYDAADSGPAGATRSRLTVTAPKGVTVGAPAWPAFKRYQTPGTEGDDYLQHVHEGQVTVRVPLALPTALPVAGLPISATLHFCVCDAEQCLAPYHVRAVGTLGSDGQLRDVRVTGAEQQDGLAPLPEGVGASGETPASQPTAREDAITLPSVGADHTLSSALVAAFLAGLLLNFMPCVLPVISLKVLSFVHQAGEDRRRVLLLTGSFVAGLMTIFALIGVLIATGASLAGTNISNNTLFAVPWLVLAMAVVFFAMGLSLLGVFELSLPSAVAEAASAVEAKREGLLAAFGKGVVATLVGIPCTGPFMAGAVSFAAAQPPAITISIWLVMGLGMASPYILLGLNPAWLKFLPKPGAWMVIFKESMGFVMLATVVWLLWAGLGVPTETTGLLGLLLGVGVACWAYGKASDAMTSEPARRVGLAVAALALVGAISFQLSVGKGQLLPPPPGAGHVVSGTDIVSNADEFIPWSAESNAAFRGRLRAVDFTANWCAICKVVNLPTFNSTLVIDRLNALGGVRMEADFTRMDPAIRQELDRVAGKGVSVPVTAIYPPNSDTPIVQTGPILPAQLMELINRAAEVK